MTCTSCQAARETQGLWPQFDRLKCQFCAARLIQQIGKLPIGNDVITARRRAVLASAVAFGHSETEIRRLAKLTELALEPVLEKAKSK